MNPTHALDYLNELATEIKGGVVLDRQGKLRAGMDELAEPARRLLATTDAVEIEVRSGSSWVFAARREYGAIVVVTSRFALPALILFDLRTVLQDLEETLNDPI